MTIRERKELLSLALKKRLEENDLNFIQPEVNLAEQTRGYRSRVKFRIFPEDEGIRFEGKHPCSGDLPVNDLLWLLPDWSHPVVKRLNLFFSRKTKRIPVDGYEVRLSHGRKEMHVTLSIRKNADHDGKDLGHMLISEFEEIIGVAAPSKGTEIGENFLQHSILGKDIFSHHRAFFQPNLLITPMILKDMKIKAPDIEADRMFDLYCGVGLFSLFLKKGNQTVIGYDSCPWAIQSAQKNAGLFQSDPEEFFHLKVENAIRDLELTPNDLVILDPPRQGCSEEVIESLIRSGCRNVCLVSCFLDSQIHDLHIWLKESYRVSSFHAYDAFPGTRFLETVCFLTKN